VKKIINGIIIALFLVGISLISYSVYQIVTGNIEVEKRLKEARERIEQAKANVDIEENGNANYHEGTWDENKSNITGEFIDPKDIQFSKGDIIGILHVPKLNRELPIVEGTDEAQLSVGVGHYIGTGYPLQDTQILLSGHRDTVFKNFKELEIGDTFILELPYGTFEYVIEDFEIVDADDTTVIGRYTDKEVLTVTTCYPFNWLGNAPDRAVFWAWPKDGTKSASSK